MRKLAGLLCVVLLVVSMAGCGKTDYEAEYKNQKENDTSEAVSTIDESEESKAPEVEKPEETKETDTSDAITDEEEKENLYEAFLAGKAKLYTDKFELKRNDNGVIVPYVEADDGLTINEFFTYVVGKVNRLYDSAPMTGLKYTYIDCGEDGTPELALKAEFDFSGVPPIREYVIKEFDGKLQLTYEDSSYYRTFTEIANQYGKIEGYGSYGAVSHGEDCGYLDADGRYNLCYKVTTSYDATLVLDYYLSNKSEELGMDMTNTYLKAYSFSKEDIEYYSDDEWVFCAQRSEGEESNGIDFAENEATCQKLFDAARVKLYTCDEIDEMIAAREKELGIRDNWKMADPVQWTEAEIDLSVINDADKIAEYNKTKAVAINPFSTENYMFEGMNICHIMDNETGVKYHFSKDTVICEGVTCYDDGCDAMTWLNRYLSHPAVVDEDESSPYFMHGFAMGDIWGIEVDENNNIVKLISICYWD